MGNEGRPIRLGGSIALEEARVETRPALPPIAGPRRSEPRPAERTPAEPRVVDLLDPVALDERLKEARARRALALAGREPIRAAARPTFAEAAASLHLPETFAAPAEEALAPAPPVAPSLPASTEPAPDAALPAAVAAEAGPARAASPASPASRSGRSS